MDAPLEQLSDGYKRRVALAAQLARAPSLLLLDEPLAGVDWPTRASLASLLGMPLPPSGLLVSRRSNKASDPAIPAMPSAALFCVVSACSNASSTSG